MEQQLTVWTCRLQARVIKHASFETTSGVKLFCIKQRVIIITPGLVDNSHDGLRLPPSLVIG